MIRVLNLPSHGQDAWAGAFPRVCCGNKAFLSLSNIIGARCGRFILWLRGRLMEGRLRTKFQDDKGYYSFKGSTRSFLVRGKVFALQGCCSAVLKVEANERQLFDLQEQTEPVSPAPLKRQQKRTCISYKEHFYWTCYGQNDRMIKFCYYKKLQPLYNHSVFKYLLLFLMLLYSWFFY